MLVLLAASASLGASLAFSATPQICGSDLAWHASDQRMPRDVASYFATRDLEVFDLRAACASWAGMYAYRREAMERASQVSEPPSPRFIVFPAQNMHVRQLAAWMARSGQVKGMERGSNYLVVSYPRGTSARRSRQIPAAPGPVRRRAVNGARPRPHRASSSRRPAPSSPCRQRLPPGNPTKPRPCPGRGPAPGRRGHCPSAAPPIHHTFHSLVSALKNNRGPRGAPIVQLRKAGGYRPPFCCATMQ